MITIDFVKRVDDWRGVVHLNMGPAGYGWIYASAILPRLRYERRGFRPAKAWPDGKIEGAWMVDGAKVADLDAAVAALNVPPDLTDDERRVLEMVPAEFKDMRDVREDIAGVPKPPGAIMPDTPHSRAMRWLDSLHQKGLIEYGRRDWPLDYKPEVTWHHSRWSPTIRRAMGRDAA